MPERPFSERFTERLTKDPLALGEPTSKTWLVFVRLPYQSDDIMIDVKTHPKPMTGRQTLALYQTLGQQFDMRVEAAEPVTFGGRR